MSSLRYRQFSILQYERNPRTGEDLHFNENNILRALQHKTIKKCTYIRHDKDVKTPQIAELNEHTDVPVGTPIPPHWQIAVKCENSTEISTIANWFGVPENMVEKLNGANAYIEAVEYLTHEHPKQQALSEQISMSKALEQDGFERSQNRGNYAINRFVENIKDTIMTDKLAEIMHEERDIIGEHRKHEATAVFREKARAEEKYLKEVSAIQLQKIHTVRQNLEAKRNEYQQYYSSVADSLNKGIEELNADKNALEVQKAEFADYKTSELQELQEKRVSLDKKEKQLNSFASRASELFCNATEYVAKAKKLYNALDMETKARYCNHIVKLDESLLPYQHQPQKQHSKSL